MNIKKIEPEDFSSFQKDVEKIRGDIDRTINLTWFYVSARFKMTQKDFQTKFSVDGRNDGGIDLFFNEGNTYYIIQSKYHARSQKESVGNITHELQKIEKTIIGENTNRGAEEFINALIRDLNNNKAYLEIIWLSTNEVTEKSRAVAQKYLDEILKNRKWEINSEINFIDRFALEGVIYDIKHGYVPHTGKKILSIEPEEYMTVGKNRNNIESIVCNVRASEILNWFENSSQINTFLQKNVRESVGDKSIINKAIRESYKSDPGLFWYKHNGIIVFADWLELDKHSKTVTLRNPQIVNGGQTITQLYRAYDENRSVNNPAKLLVRIYRLPYEDSETYKRSIDIIAALNSQNKIKSSDLHSTDPRQVMLENRIDELGLRFHYYRKRSDQGKIVSLYNVFMAKLAFVFYVCHYKKPDEGIAAGIESYFEEEKRYNDAFPESLIKKNISNDVSHIVFNYLDSWKLSYIIDGNLKYDLSDKQIEYYQYVYWYILVDVYQQLQQWKEKHYFATWREWMEFIDSSEFTNGVIKYSKQRYVYYVSILPKKELNPRSYYKSLNGRNKFLRNCGKTSVFKNIIGKSYKLFRKNSGYETK